MFDIGFGEILLVLFLIIVFIKPEDLPGLIRKLGHFYGQVMRIYYTVLDEIQEVADLGRPSGKSRDR